MIPARMRRPRFWSGGLGAQELMQGGVARARGQPRGDQLAEAGACVLGVGETWGDDTPEAAEQLTHLYDECEKQDILEAEHYPDLDGA